MGNKRQGMAKHRQTFKFVCKFCGKDKVGRHNQLYCLDTVCIGNRTTGKTQYSNLSSKTVSTIQELRVVTDLLIREYNVFKSVTPTGTNCSILAVKNNRHYDIEVRTGYFTNNNSMYYNKNNIKTKYVAVVLTKEIKYIPNLE